MKPARPLSSNSSVTVELLQAHVGYTETLKGDGMKEAAPAERTDH